MRPPRTICEVLKELQRRAKATRDQEALILAREATIMAKRMQAKLIEAGSFYLVAGEWLTRAQYKASKRRAR